ncbi:CDC73-domain-containing protein [Xylona heveae TC161]|uniref:CDC73-domain-containing protein n=1 Tax=Xylona heveae (strain CBS 132557 / TC161) TaxID=1328760 RepID=A0A161TGM3_XYLHT|nr:CDC73-domain-containing protein [Xylona heveae TC161]KZF25327.1 CDC73-domain-containing protein [Xylona heveae TC161]
MANVTDQASADPLLRLRQSIAANSPPVPTKSADADASASDAVPSIATATHLLFSKPDRKAFPLDTPTRFVPSGEPVDLRSIYFAWQKKDVAIPDYIASAQRLNEELGGSGGAGGKVRNLVFVERLDLITWLEGASEESEYIKPLAGDSAAAAAAAGSSADVASGAAGGIAPVPSGAPGASLAAGPGGRPVKTIDPRLAEIYRGERRMGDRNTILRGIKPTEFSHVRKAAESFLARARSARAGAGASGTHPAIASSTAAALGLPGSLSQPSLVSLPSKRGSGRRPEPIILLSPSASSLLRMSNIKSFLESGLYIPADSALAGSSNTANILHISRLLPSIDAQRPMRFILVDTPEQFKPDYWSRVVAVFTTGQAWQFKSYKWPSPPDLFRNVLGIYIGWRGEDVPSSVKGWGRGVMKTQVDKWNNHFGVQGRWRDREVVEEIWLAIEESMRAKGWTRDAGPAMR